MIRMPEGAATLLSGQGNVLAADPDDFGNHPVNQLSELPVVSVRSDCPLVQIERTINLDLDNMAAS